MRTQAQQDLLQENPQFEVLDRLTDGDLLIADQIDRPTAALEHPHRQSTPYVLTRDGKVQEVGYHYRYFHLRNIPAVFASDCSPSLSGLHYPQNHN